MSRLSGMRSHLPLALHVLTAAMALLATVLGAWAWRFDRRLDDELVRAARTQSEVLARDFAEEFQAASTIATERMLGFLRTRSYLEPGVTDSILARARAAEACDCGPAHAIEGTFAWRSETPGHLEVRGIDSAAAAALLRRLQLLEARDPVSGPVAYVLKSDVEGHEIMAITLFRRPGPGRTWSAGALGIADSVRTRFLEPIAHQVAAARLGAAARHVAAWRVTRPNGDTLVRIGQLDPAAPAVTNRFWQSRFSPDSSGPSYGFLEPSGTSRAARSRPMVVPGQADARLTPWLVVAQVSPAAMAAQLYGSRRVPAIVVATLVGACLALAVAMLWLSRRLVRHLEEREAFATAVAHDLRTPLTQILLYAESLQLARPAEESRRNAARIIVRETRRLVHIVENAMTFVRGRRSPPRLDFVRLDVTGAIHEAVASREAILARVGTRVRIEAADNLGVNLDAHAFAQVMGNLLDNALRFGPEGQDIVIRASTTGDTVRVEVEDQGEGIPADLRDAVFRPFVRSAASGGTGIGLAVARQLVELMNGRIDVRDGATGGACFVVEFAAWRDVTVPAGV